MENFVTPFREWVMVFVSLHSPHSPTSCWQHCLNRSAADRISFWYMTPPSDASLERGFYKHRADFEQIVMMMEQDSHMQRIAEDFTRNDDWDEHPDRATEISEQRWNQHREIFHRAGVPMG